MRMGWRRWRIRGSSAEQQIRGKSRASFPPQTAGQLADTLGNMCHLLLGNICVWSNRHSTRGLSLARSSIDGPDDRRASFTLISRHDPEHGVRDESMCVFLNTRAAHVVTDTKKTCLTTTRFPDCGM